MALRMLIVGAHPDDADYAAGGTAALYRSIGYEVLMVSLTNGDAGHHAEPGPRLAERRRKEATAAAAVIGATYRIFDIHDGELLPTLENRKQIIRLLRNFAPDLVLTHRPNDYHPDHRYTSQLVQDAAYMVTVPAVVPAVPHLARDPVIAYLPDEFQRPYPFTPTIAVDVGPKVERIIDMLHCHTSQFYEWLPFNRGRESVPVDERARWNWLADQIKPKLRRQADCYRDLLVKLYGPERGNRIEYAEGFEGCEYGAPLDEAACRKLFPFVYHDLKPEAAMHG